jgi:transcriptional regulator GlxA family with amidase domain
MAFVKKASKTSTWVLSICTGSGISARSGILDGIRSTTNKRAWATVLAWGPRVKWVAVARWVIDGKFWSSSGVSAGTDATLAWVASIFGEAAAQNVANGMEWLGDFKNSTHDPFAAVYNLTAANNTNGA